MAFTQSQIDALEKAISTGSRKVTYGNKTVEYHSLSEMLTLLSTMKKEVLGDPDINQRKTTAKFKSTIY